MSSLVIGPYDLLDMTSPVTLLHGFDHGNPQSETQTVARLLYDGDVVTGTRSGNRSIKLPLLVRGGTSTSRAAVIETLSAIVSKPFTMTWTPGDGLPVVFDCYRAQPIVEYDALHALQGAQGLSLDFQAAPHTRTPSPLLLTPTVSPSVTLDAYDSTTGLTVTGATATTVSAPNVAGSGSVKLTYTIPAATGTGTTTDPVVAGQVTVGLARTFTAVDLSSAATVSIWAQSPAGDGGASRTLTLTLSSSGGSKTWQIQASPYGDGWKFITWDLAATPTSSTGTLDLTAVTGYAWTLYTSNYGRGANSVDLYVDQLAGYQGGGASNLTGAAGYVRFDGVRGSARTPATIVVDAGMAVGRLLLARSPNPPPNFSPILPTPVSGTSTSDATALHGSYYTAPVYRIGATTVRGTYTVVARMKYGASQVISVAAQLTGDSFVQTISANVTTAATAYQLLPIGELTLPTRDVDGTNTAATIDISITGTSTIQVDQVYLIDTAGESLLVDLAGGLMRYWFLDAPSPTQFTGRVLAGSLPNRSNAISVSPYLRGPAAFNLDPGTNNLLVVCDQTAFIPTVTCSYYPRNLYERSS